MREFTRMWADLAPVGRVASSGGYRRFAWTREDHDLREWFAGECARRGLDLVTDRVGNQWAWWGDPDAAVAAGRSGLVTGSHLDSVPDGGAFDGPLGVVSAFAALDLLRERGHEPDRPIGIANFVDEEGARFGVACAGSRILTGALAPDRARALTDDEGRTMAGAMTVAGHDPSHLCRDDEVLARIGTYVELHVEQGRHLVDLGAAVGVGTDIWPHGRWRIDLPGAANHAGTTRLEDRLDAMLGVAAVTIAARRAAEEHDCVATVGKVQLTPNGVNAIPSHAAAWLDARGMSPERVRATVAEVAEVAEEFGGVVREESWTATTLFDQGLAGRLSTRLGDAPLLGTGAGHDAGILATHGISTAMLFVRNPTGISHSPAEHAEEADCLAGVTALADVLVELTGGADR
ncbi:MAG: allantoate amidohydrolase [Intrasporangiaceae bacterium]|nr:allantoate amidohydrolase [Intrasporangiaceae bacterium]